LALLAGIFSKNLQSKLGLNKKKIPKLLIGMVESAAPEA
jgi:hypothetical protein